MIQLRTGVILTIVFFALTLLSPKNSTHQKEDKMNDQFKLVVHGGAGTIKKENMTEEKAKRYRKALKKALQAGYDVLKEGGTSVEAVETTIKVLENSKLFNAGKGAVFTNEGKNEMDASIMDGRDLNAGAVAAATRIKNPISGARKVMEESPHVMLSGRGANSFAKQHGVELADPEYFKTKKRWKQYKKAHEKDEQKLDHSDEENEGEGSILERLENNKFGTVGAVALDKDGNLAAGTSTGGLTNKRFGRIGDSPTIGAGT
jgi:beta-aspartyl-peptidase (threonine type)